MNSKKRLYTETVFAFINNHFPGTTIYEGIILNQDSKFYPNFGFGLVFSYFMNPHRKSVSLSIGSNEIFNFICSDDNLFGLQD